MGKKHRDNRKIIKKKFLNIPKGWRENEFGELCKTLSKAEVRKNILRHRQLILQAERDIIELAAKKASEEIMKQLDQEVFAGW